MITIHLYAGLRDLAKLSRLDLPWSNDMTIATLRATLCSNYPTLASLLMRSNIAINDQISSEEQPIPDNAEIAILPPVSGG